MGYRKDHRDRDERRKHKRQSPSPAVNRKRKFNKKKGSMKYCLHQKIHLILQQPSTQNLHRNLLQHLHHDLHHQ